MMRGSKTILAIDDDITVLNGIRTVLERSYEVSLAKNTDIAKTILNTTTIDLILLDMNMPGTSGMDFLEFLRGDENHYHIPVIIVSSQGTADVIVEIKKRGAVDFVVKPISPDILKEKIRSCLQTAGIKIGHKALEFKLQKLVNASVAGRSGDVEEVIEDLEQIFYEQKIDVELAEICKYAREMEYNLVAQKAKELLKKLTEEKTSFD